MPPADPAARPLWRCPRCGHTFVTRNLAHSCGNWTLERHFADKPPFVRACFDALVAALRRFGPFKIEPQKTRIVFQVRVRFAGGQALRSGFRGAFWLTAPAPGAPVDRIEKITESCYVHSFLLKSPRDLCASLRRRLGQAYRVGRQEHLARRAGPSRLSADRRPRPGAASPPSGRRRAAAGARRPASRRSAARGRIPSGRRPGRRSRRPA